VKFGRTKRLHLTAACALRSSLCRDWCIPFAHQSCSSESVWSRNRVTPASPHLAHDGTYQKLSPIRSALEVRAVLRKMKESPFRQEALSSPEIRGTRQIEQIFAPKSFLLGIRDAAIILLECETPPAWR